MKNLDNNQEIISSYSSVADCYNGMKRKMPSTTLIGVKRALEALKNILNRDRNLIRFIKEEEKYE